MVKLPKSWVNKKSPTNHEKQEQHKNRKTKSQLDHLWEDHDWQLQLKDYLDGNIIGILSEK